MIKCSIIINSFGDNLNSLNNELIKIGNLSKDVFLDYEILVSSNSKKDLIKNNKIKYFFYEKKTSVECLNEMTRLSDGDIILYSHQDMILPENLFYGVAGFHSNFFNRDVKISSISRNPFHKGDRLPFGSQSPHSTTTKNYLKFKEINDIPGEIVKFPILFRDSLYNILDGYIFHPKMKHHWVDNYLGTFLSLKYEPIYEFKYNDFYYKTNSNHRSNHEFDSHDENLFLKFTVDLLNNNKNKYI